MDFPGEMPFTIACHHIEPDHLDLRVLDQDQVWVDRQAVVHPLAVDSMGMPYLVNVAMFLREQAESLRLKVVVANTIERVYALLTDQPGPPPADLAMPSLEWLNGTTLMRRLLELTESDHDR